MASPSSTYDGRSDVADMWQDDQGRPTSINDHQHVRAGQPHNADNGQRHPLSVPRFPWYY